MSQAILSRANDLKPQYMWMGNWRSKVHSKTNRGSRTSSKRARLYVAVPPASGWPGGMPENNGYRRSAGK